MEPNPQVPYKHFKIRLLLLSGFIYLLSLTQNAYCLTNSCTNSLLALIAGGLSIAIGCACYCWFANPLLVYAWVKCYRSTGRSLLASLVATLFAFGFLWIRQLPVSEAVQYEALTSRGAGYWLWLCSCFVMLIGNLWLWLKEREDQQLIQD